MKKEFTFCDREHCKRDNALKIMLFKERKMDNAGDMEDWHYAFDLCAPDQQTLLDHIFEHVRHEPFTKDDALALLNTLKIKFRVE